MSAVPSDFRWFWAARCVSVLGSAVTTAVLPILVYRETQSASSTAVLGVLAVAPYPVFGLVAGTLADRWDRRRLLVATDLLNALLLGSIPVAGALGVLGLPQIYAVALLSACLFVWFDAATFGAVPALVGRDALPLANSRLWSSTTALEMAGPAVGGLLAAAVGPALAVSVNALSFLASALLLLRIRSTMRLDSQAPRRALTSEAREGLAYLWGQPLVRTLTLVGFGNALTAGGVSSLVVVFAVRGLGLADDDGRIGLLMSAGALGGLVASLLLPRLLARVPAPRLTVYGLTLSPLLLAVASRAGTLWTALPAYLAWHTCYELVVINGITLRQQLVPDRLQGRVNTAARLLTASGLPLGAAIGGLAADRVAVRDTWLLLGVFVGTAALVAWRSALVGRSEPAAGT